MSQFDLVIFDCDGTLVDSETLNNVATSEILSEIGLEQYTPDYGMATFIGKAQPAVWKIIEEQTGKPLPADINQRYIERIARNRDLYLKPAPDALRVAEYIGKTHKICVASNGESENVRTAIEGAGLSPFFLPDQIYVAAMVQNPKPKPDLFLFAAKQNNADPARTLVIEDSIVGASAGIAAGMIVYGYTGLAHDPAVQAQKMREIGVHHISDSLLGILDVVKAAEAA
ncbi:MAG: putative Haloacid dehalogenase-like hydrolase [Micavibrio sp.]|nr:putative Haloacid dehalogenase-like hydrolase [Micavibrio sp.]